MRIFSSVYVILFIIVVFAGILRFYNLAGDPPGLYIDEVAIGYNAYTILTTGKDEYGTSWPLAFRSYGDYKMPGYIYLTAASMAIFGKNDFAVRFPSAILGTLTVGLLYFFCKELFDRCKDTFIRERADLIALTASFLLAISSWHIQFSHAGFEVNVGLFLMLLGVLCMFYYYKSEQIRYFILAIASFLLAFYTYHIYRILIPLIILILGYIWIRYKQHILKKTAIYSLAGFILALPMIIFSFSANGLERLSATSAFSGVHSKSLILNFLNDLSIYLHNYLSYFSWQFLFIQGDQMGRHQIPGFGEFALWEWPFLLIGAFMLLKLKSSWGKWMLFICIAISPMAAALGNPTPHALRALPLVIPLTIIIAIGLIYILSVSKNICS